MRLFIICKKAKEEGALFKWALSLMLGGAIGNFIDRVLRQEVVDFIHTFPFGYNFPIFNIADSSLSCWCWFIN